PARPWGFQELSAHAAPHDCPPLGRVIRLKSPHRKSPAHRKPIRSDAIGPITQVVFHLNRLDFLVLRGQIRELDTRIHFRYFRAWVGLRWPVGHLTDTLDSQ